jgi:hypothetical protein
MPNNFRKYPVKQEQFKDIQALLYKLKDFQDLGFLFPNSRTFKDFQVLYEYDLTTHSIPWSSHFGHTPCSFSDENKFLQQRRLSVKRPNTFQNTQIWSTLCRQHVYVS